MNVTKIKLPAPAYWSRWAILVDDVQVGIIERRGGFAGWAVKDADGRLMYTGIPTRADAITQLTPDDPGRSPGSATPPPCFWEGNR